MGVVAEADRIREDTRVVVVGTLRTAAAVVADLMGIPAADTDTGILHYQKRKKKSISEVI